MRSHRSVLALALLLFCADLTSCSKGVFSSPLYLAVSITPRPVSIPAGGTVVLSGSVTNNLSVPTWSLLNAGNTSSAGTLTSVSGKPNSILYTAPSAPPIYNPAAAGFTQGTVTIQATVVPPAGSAGLPDGTDSVTVFITSPNISVGLSPAAVTVPLGEQQYFAGYAVGNVNNGLTYQVNGVTGGSVATGTITTQGIYTAPAVMPVTGNTVTIKIISVADPTQSATATVTLV